MRTSTSDAGLPASIWNTLMGQGMSGMSWSAERWDTKGYKSHTKSRSKIGRPIMSGHSQLVFKEYSLHHQNLVSLLSAVFWLDSFGEEIFCKTATMKATDSYMTQKRKIWHKKETRRSKLLTTQLQVRRDCRTQRWFRIKVDGRRRIPTEANHSNRVIIESCWINLTKAILRCCRMAWMLRMAWSGDGVICKQK